MKKQQEERIDYNFCKGFLHAVLDYEGVIETSKNDRKVSIFFMIIGTVIICAICIGIMYLRFRVFGG